MEVYLRNEDLINKLKNIDDDKATIAVKSYEKMRLCYVISIIELIIEIIAVLVLQYMHVNDIVLSIISIVIVITLFADSLICRFVIGKDYYNYIKNNNITVIQNCAK